MLAGVALVLVGFGLLWSARDAGEVNRDVVRWQAQHARPGRWRRWLELQARVSPQVNVWVGRLFAAAAFAGGLILILRG
jgi:hypothetical protein